MITSIFFLCLLYQEIIVVSDERLKYTVIFQISVDDALPS